MPLAAASHPPLVPPSAASPYRVRTHRRSPPATTVPVRQSSPSPVADHRYPLTTVVRRCPRPPPTVTVAPTSIACRSEQIFFTSCI
ncbi:hypothetical protein GUJ93_ZPchr0001g29860 [Zizania palustris]|uniref:Uncharacterized protein n=1 Tax=Zizania palustris TaxID=103762 RepID=A0A8J5REY8_ZIZPA|nr:hypothetical protein GUJ93_ZPchr0001g29860 [Zizania palustris]